MKLQKFIRPLLPLIETLETRIAPATFVWNSGVSGMWSDASKWFNNDAGAINQGVPDDLNDIAIFNTTSGSPTVSLDANFTIQQLNFTGAGSPTIAPTILGSPLALNFERVGSAAVISSTGTGSPVISAKVNASAGFGVDIHVTGPNELVLSGPLTETSGYFNKTGLGAAKFSGAAQNVFSQSRGVEVVAGTLRLSKDPGALPATGDFTVFGGGTLIVTNDLIPGNEEIANTSALTLNGTGVFRIEAPLGETVRSLTGNGVVDLVGNRLSVASTSTFAGTFSSSGTIGGVAASGDQRLDLSGTQTASVNLAVDGLVRMLPGSNFATSTFTLQQNSGTQSILDGDGTVGSVSGGTVSGMTFITPGTSGVGGLLSVASLAPGATNLDLGITVVGTAGAGLAAGHDQIIVRPGGTVNLSGGSLSKNFGSFVPSVGQTFKLIDNQGTAPIAGVLTDISGGPALVEGATVQTFNSGNTVVKISYVGGDGNDLVYNVTDAAGNGGPVTFNPGGTPGLGTQTQTTAIVASQTVNFIFDVSAATADQVVVSGAGSIAVDAADFGTINFPASAPALGTIFRLIDVRNSSTIAPIPGLAAGLVKDYGTVRLALSYNGGDGNDVILTTLGQVVAASAPTISPDGRSATFTDLDGDIVTVKTDRGGFSAANFAMTAFAGGTGSALQALDLSFANFGEQFQGANIKIKVMQAGAGDGFVNVGRINATGVDLGVVKVSGDLSQIDAGDSDASTAGLDALKTIAMGVNALNPLFGFAADPAGGLTSSIVGKVGLLQVTKGLANYTGPSGIVRAFIDVTGGAITKLGKIVFVNVDQLTGQDDAPSTRDAAGLITFASGTIRASGSIGFATVNAGGLTGAAGDYSGDLWSRRAIGSVTVNGSVAGGAGFDSGAIFTGSPDDGSANAIFGKTLAFAKIKGSLVGGSGVNSGTLYADGALGKIKVIGNILGGTAASTGAIVTSGAIGSVKIGGTMTGTGFQYSGSIVAFGGGANSISVAQALAVTGSGFGLSGVFVNGNLGSLATGALNATGPGSGAIVALGGIGSIAIAGNATNWNIAAGFDTEFAQDANGSATDGISYNPDATIGAVAVGGNFAGGSITAGTLFGADFAAGGADDIHMPGDTFPSLLASIASIVIAGQTSNAVFEAQQVTALTIAGASIPLTAGADNLAIPTNSLVREL